MNQKVSICTRMLKKSHVCNQFDASTKNGSWIELPTTLRRSNRNFVAMLVDSSLFPSCNEGMYIIIDLQSIIFRQGHIFQLKGERGTPEMKNKASVMRIRTMHMKYNLNCLSTEKAPSHKLDTLLNPEKAVKYKMNKEKAMEDIRASVQMIVK